MASALPGYPCPVRQCNRVHDDKASLVAHINEGHPGFLVGADSLLKAGLRICGLCDLAVDADGNHTCVSTTQFNLIRPPCPSWRLKKGLTPRNPNVRPLSTTKAAAKRCCPSSAVVARLLKRSSATAFSTTTPLMSLIDEILYSTSTSPNIVPSTNGITSPASTLPEAPQGNAAPPETPHSSSLLHSSHPPPHAMPPPTITSHASPYSESPPSSPQRCAAPQCVPSPPKSFTSAPIVHPSPPPPHTAPPPEVITPCSSPSVEAPPTSPQRDTTPQCVATPPESPPLATLLNRPPPAHITPLPEVTTPSASLHLEAPPISSQHDTSKSHAASPGPSSPATVLYPPPPSPHTAHPLVNTSLRASPLSKAQAISTQRDATPHEDTPVSLHRKRDRKTHV